MSRGHNDPEIMIGCFAGSGEMGSSGLPDPAEIMYGIEEEGCICSAYEMETEDDIRFTIADICITVSDIQVSIYARDAGASEVIIRQIPDESTEKKEMMFRIMGKNAARYLKGQKLSICEV